MSSCIGCTCTKPAAVGRGGSLLLATQVSHHLTSLRAVVREHGAEARERTAGVLEVTTGDLEGLVAAALQTLTSVEAAEVRAVPLDGQGGDDLLALTMLAPTLQQLAARGRHADLLPLFADEVNAFHSVYQPIVSLRHDDAAGGPRVTGHEALLRATGPQGPVMPVDLFGAAERAGWLHVLDRVGRTTALRGAQGWLGDDLLFVNFLPTTIYRPEVCLRTTEVAAERAGLRLEQLVFEVTESERITDVDHLERVFTYYRDRGCRVALDDLGAGYSSLNLLVRLKPDVVKLDKDIVQRLPDPASAAVVSAVVDITHAYGGQVLAECVETEAQADCARALGVDLGQGWYFGRPVERGPSPVPVRTPAATVVQDARAFAGNDPAVSLVLAPTAAAEPAIVPTPAAGPTPAPTTTVRAAPAPTAVKPLTVADAVLQRALAASINGVTISDMTQPDQPLVYVNQAFEALAGFRGEELLGRNCRFLQGDGTSADAVDRLRSAIAEGRECRVTLLNYRGPERTPWWNEIHMAPVVDEAGRVVQYVGVQNDVTARVDAEQALERERDRALSYHAQIEQLAFTDSLTGLMNRRRFEDRVEVALWNASSGDDAFAVLFMDLDGFKAVNDSLGHAAGDDLLVQVAQRLQTRLRRSDLAARLGGDEFLVALVGLDVATAGEVADRVARELTEAVGAPYQVAGQTVRISASIGVSTFPADAGSASGLPQLLQLADSRMYAVKHAGRRDRPGA